MGRIFDIIDRGVNMLLPVGFAIAAGYFANESLNYRSNFIERTDKVQEGYAIPNKLEVKLENTDTDDERETFLVYDGRPYALKVDGEGGLRLEAYESELEE